MRRLVGLNLLSGLKTLFPTLSQAVVAALLFTATTLILVFVGKRLVVIIDEVHFLNAESLHMLRTLSNIEVPDHKLITVLLFGEQTFLKKMKNPRYRAIFSRMFVRTEIRPLYIHELEQYVKFRLLVSGGSPDLIPSSAIPPLYERSKGIPREINRICHNAIRLSAREGKRQVDADAILRQPAAPPVED